MTTDNDTSTPVRKKGELCFTCYGKGYTGWRCTGAHSHEYTICTTCNGSGRLIWTSVSTVSV